MKKFTKILSVLLSAVILVTALCIPAGAASILDTAKAVNSGKKVTFQMKLPESIFDSAVYYDYKVTLSKKGTLKITVDSAVQNTYLQVMDKNGKKFEYTDFSVTSGSVSYSSYYAYAKITWNKSIEKSKVTLKYSSLPKGTYYIRAYTERYNTISGKTSLSFSYPQEEKKSEGTISYLSAELEEGSSLQLGAVLDGEGTVKWNSSDKAVASVTSKGKITAKSEGSAVITAKLGSSSVKIKIKVTG